MVPLLWVLGLLKPEMRTTIFKSYALTASKGYCKIDSSPLAVAPGFPAVAEKRSQMQKWRWQAQR